MPWPWQQILAGLCGADAVELLERDARTVAAEPGRFGRFVAVTDQLAVACRRSPACVIIDDVHAADLGALLLLRFVARSLARVRLALVITRRRDHRRSDGSATRLDEIERAGTPLGLRHFDLTETTEFLAAHGLGDLDPALFLVLLRVPGGNPLFLRRGIPAGAAARAGQGPRPRSWPSRHAGRFCGQPVTGRACTREAAASAAQYMLLGGFASVVAGISAQGLTGFARDNMGLHGAWPYLLFLALDGAAGVCAVLLTRRAARAESGLAPRLAVWGPVAASASFNFTHAPPRRPATPVAFGLMPVIAAILFEFTLRELQLRAGRGVVRVFPVLAGEVVSQAPIRRRPGAGGCHDHVSGTRAAQS